MPKQSTAFIYFDLGNVLLLFDRHTACRQVSELVGLPPAKIDQLIYASGLQTRYEAGRINCQEFYARFCHESGTRPGESAFFYATSDIFRLNEPVLPIVWHLDQVGYKLGLLSNTCHSHWQHISVTSLRQVRPLFGPAVLSYEVGSSKPDPLIYETAIRRAGCDAEQIFFIDDRPENVAAARQAGMDAEVFVDAGTLVEMLRGRGIDPPLEGERPLHDEQ